MNKHFIKANPVLEKIENAGFEAYYVGGCVRDFLLNKDISDVDIATSAFPEEIKSIFPHTVDIGIAHGTVLVLENKTGYEITTFRTESTYQDYRRPDSVMFIRELKDDLMRRDFTINALAMNRQGVIFDYFDGQKDLEKQIIRAVGSATDRFCEDALRMMRGVRFCGQLGFNIDDQTLEGISVNASLLEKIAIERIAVEFQKLLASDYKLKGIKAMLQTDLYQYCPGLSKCKESLLRLGQMSIYHEDFVNWGLLLYLQNYTPQQSKSFLKQWKLSNDVQQKAMLLLSAIRYALSHETWDNIFLFETPFEVVVKAQSIVEELTGKVKKSRIEELYEQLPIRHNSDLVVNGKDIMQLLNRADSGAYIGEIIADIKQAVLLNKLVNSKEILENYIIEHYSN